MQAKWIKRDPGVYMVLIRSKGLLTLWSMEVEALNEQQFTVIKNSEILPSKTIVKF